jgi:energy-coupling factor transport system permease protein
VHPIIRILCFLVLAGWLAAAGAERLMAALSTLALAATAAPAGTLAATWAMLRRLRWFFLSLLIVYGWFTSMPADSARSDWLHALLPGAAGLMAGLERVIALACIVYAVSLLLRVSSREDLLRGVYMLARPFAVFGLRPERVALRLLLVMDALDATRTGLRAGLPRYARRARLRDVGDYAAGLLEDTIDRAERRESEEIVFDPGGLPPSWQWLLPLALFGLLFLLAAAMQAVLAA